MSNIEELGLLVSTDVLVIGGGIGGEVAAIRAKEANPDLDVLLVDKQTIGYGGKASKGGGVFVVFDEGQNPEKFVEYHVKNLGMYLEDQDLLLSYAQDTLGNIKDLDRWGVTICKDSEGKLIFAKNTFNGFWSFAAADLDMMLKLRSTARKLNVKQMNKIHIVDLLKKDNKISGAVGFNIITGQFCMFQAKAVILANGSCNYRGAQMWAAGTGDGIAAAFRAGAEMRNAEFANCCANILTKDTEDTADRRYLYNSAGEHISPKYDPVALPDTPLSVNLGVEKEISEGRGPIYEDLSKRSADAPGVLADFSVFIRPVMAAYKGREIAKKNAFRSKQGSPSPKREVIYRQISEMSCIKVNHNMQSSLEGLFAVGDTCYDGSAIAGALAGPPAMMRGSGLGFALFSGCRAGGAASSYAAKANALQIDPERVKLLKQNIMAPLNLKDGYSPVDLLLDIQKVVIPAPNSVRRTGDRLKAAISKIEMFKRELLPRLSAKDFHYLSKCHEVSSMLACAEITFRAALERTESRGNHYREDYPARNDKDWLKWLIVKDDGGKMKFSKEPVPINQYKNKPGKGAQ